jgi:hypothetical protein
MRKTVFLEMALVLTLAARLLLARAYKKQSALNFKNAFTSLQFIPPDQRC